MARVLSNKRKHEAKRHKHDDSNPAKALEKAIDKSLSHERLNHNKIRVLGAQIVAHDIRVARHQQITPLDTAIADIRRLERDCRVFWDEERLSHYLALHTLIDAHHRKVALRMNPPQEQPAMPAPVQPAQVNKGRRFCIQFG